MNVRLDYYKICPSTADSLRRVPQNKMLQNMRSTGIKRVAPNSELVNSHGTPSMSEEIHDDNAREM